MSEGEATERISVPELRRQLLHPEGRPFRDDDVELFDWDLTDIGCAEVLALVEAVEAAKDHLAEDYDRTYLRLETALARFDFGQPATEGAA